MARETEQLDRDASLMLYLAEEMPAPDRDAFEQRLGADGALAAELEALRRAQEVSFAALAHGDGARRLPASEGVAARRVSRAIHQWHTGRVKSSGESRRRGLPLPWWCYPAAAAASIVTAFLVWSSRQEIAPMPAVVTPFHFVDLEREQLADLMDSSLAFDEGIWDTASADAILDVPLSSSRTDDLRSIFFLPGSSETLQ